MPPPAFRSAPATLALVLAPVLLLHACGDSPSEPPPGETGPLVQGRVHAAGGGEVGGLWATWHADDGGPVDSARVTADGSFELRLSTPEGSGELRVDGPPPRSFHPFLFPFSVDSLADGPHIVMVPRSWTVRRGIYQGRTVPTSLDPAMEDDAGQMRYTYYFMQHEPFADPDRYLLSLQSWPLDRLPARVAFDHRDGSWAVAPADSAAIWGVLDRMEEIFGIDLFEPATADADWWSGPPTFTDEELVPGVIRVLFHPPESAWRGLGLSEETRRWRRELGDWAAGSRFTAVEVEHRSLNGGVLGIGTLDSLRLADGWIPWETVLMHEVMHVLGAGHTFRIPSTQGPRMRTAEPSLQDVAYLELLREVMAVARAEETFLGIVPATVGERRILLDRSALPDLDGTAAFSPL